MALGLCLTALPTTGHAYNLIQRGDSGEAVKELQIALRDHGYFFADITGYYGEATERAVTNFQKYNDLEQVGYVGMKTADLLDLDGKVSGDEGDSTPEADTSSSSDSDRKQFDGKTYSASTLVYGDTSDAVKQAQQQLKKAGYLSANATGYFGDATLEAVKDFQKDKGIQTLGVIGPATKEALGKVSDSSSDENPAATTDENGLRTYNGVVYAESSLIPGDRSDAVKSFQQRLIDLGYLKTEATGYFGPATLEATKKFQKQAGLSVTGCAGRMTRDAIESGSAPKYDGKTTASTNTSNANASSGGSSDTSDRAPDANASLGQQVVDYAKQFLGVPYVYGGNGPNSFDCSGLTSYVFRQFGVSLPRSAQAQGYNAGSKVSSMSNLQKGDIVCFNTVSDNDLSDHVGIYIGGGQFIHSPKPGKSVEITNMTSGYYLRNFSWARRVL
ncbi:MAG: peptidoglycan-binding protein [Christensenellales bacterium]